MKTVINNDVILKTEKIKFSDCIKTLKFEIKITGRKAIETRIKIAALVFRFGAFITGAKSKIEIEIKE